MTVLISNSLATAFEIAPLGERPSIDVWSIDLTDRSVSLVARKVAPGVGACLQAVQEYQVRNGLLTSRYDAPLKILVKQYAQYRDNLYGFYRVQRDRDDCEWVEPFKDAYNFDFAIELSWVFHQLSKDGVNLFDHLKVDDFPDDTAYLQLMTTYRRWRQSGGIEDSF